MTQTLSTAKDTFRDEADLQMVALHDELLLKGRARWVADPVWPGVYGLVMGGDALVVVYADGNWAVADDFYDLI